MEKIRQNLQTLVRDLKYPPQNPAYVITKDDIIDALNEALNYVDSVSADNLYDLADLGRTIDDASSEVSDVSDDVSFIENRLTKLYDKMKKHGTEIYLDEIDDIKSDVGDVRDKLDNISFNLSY